MRQDRTAYIAHPDSWAAHLDPDETLVWTGLPIRAFRWHTHGWIPSLVFLGQVTFALVLLSFLSLAVGLLNDMPMTLIVVIYLTPGLMMLALKALWNWLKRRSAHYALTSKRAVVAQQFPFKRLLSYPIYRDQPLILGETNPRSIFFAHSKKRVGKFSSYQILHGFEHLEDFETALEHATSVQSRAPWRPRSYTGKTIQWPLKSSGANAA